MQPSIIELRYFRLRLGPQVERTTEYLRQGVVPACERTGIGPLGCFAAYIAADMPFLLTVTGYPSLAAVEIAREKLAADREFQEASEAFNATPELSYVRMECTLLRAFPGFPAIVPPAPGKQIFELRTYESPNDRTLARKIKVFEEDGEIGIFRRIGIVPVFFGQTIAGPRMPNITYLTAFDDLAARDVCWKTFVADPEWHKVRTGPGTTDPDIVSNRTHVILRPLPFSPLR